MALVNNIEMLKKAQSQKKAIGGFNFTTLEQLKSILKVANEQRYPVIIQASESAINFIGLETLVAMVKSETKNLKIDVCLNLDHGKDFEICKKAIDAGFTNVMIDCSSKPMEENILITKKVVEYAHSKNVSVEAELGALKGKEDAVQSRESVFTKPEEAEYFVKATNVDSLAVSIGTSHGAYKFSGESFLDIDRLKQIKSLIDIPLVLHGASMVDQNLLAEFEASGGNIGSAKGVSKQNLKDAINNGICKVNMDTDFRLAFTTGVRNSLKDSKVFNLRDYLKNGQNEMEKRILERILILSN